MRKTYIAVIGDAVASRSLPAAQRARLQRELRRAVAEVNRRWSRGLAAKFAITEGDQFQGLLAVPKKPNTVHAAVANRVPMLWELLHWLRAELRASEWIVACGQGPVSTPLAPTAPEIDGPCFHLARQALEQAKRKRLVLAFEGFDAAVTALSHYYSALYWSWTARQRQVAIHLRARGRVELAKRLRITPSAISHVTNRMSWRLVEAGDETFRRLLNAR